MGTADRVLRVVLGAGTIAVVLLLAIHRSDDAAVMGRYSLSYFATVLCLLPAVAAALGLALRGGRTLAAIAAAAAEPRLYLVFGLLWTPLALAAAYWSREESGVLRLLALCGLGIAPVLRAVWVAGSRGRTGVRAFASRAAVSVAAFYAVVLLFSPMLGRRVELEIGKSGITTIDVVSRRDVSGLSELGQKPDADFMYPGQPGRVREFSVRVRNNSWGFHDRERSFENPEGRTRLVVLGDNYVRGLEVPREAGLAAVLEQRLNARADRYEVVPLARNGIGQQGEIELLREFGLRLDPSVVILVWATNDLLDNDPALRDLTRPPPSALLFPGLAIDRLLTEWLYHRAYLLDDRLRLGALRPDYWMLLDPQPPPVAAALGRTEALLDEIVNLCREREIELLLTARLPNNVLRWLRRFPGLRSYRFRPDAHHLWLESYARSREIHYVHLAPTFQAYYDEHPTGDPQQATWPNNGAWREPGHRIFAEEIQAYLRENDLVPLPDSSPGL